MDILNIIVLAISFLILVMLVIIFKFYKTSLFFMIVLSYFILYFPPTIFYAELEINKDLLVKFYLLYFISLVFFILGFSYKNNYDKIKLKKLGSSELVKAKKYIVVATLLKFAIILLSNYIYYDVVRGIVFILDDVSTILFFGVFWVIITSNKNHVIKIVYILILVLIFNLDNILNFFEGKEYSRYLFMLPLLIIAIYFFEIVREKFITTFAFILMLLFLIFNVNFLNRGDLLILKHATNVLEGLEDNTTSFKPFLILYSLGFYMMPDPFEIKPKFYTANGQYMLDILHFSPREVELYPYGVGITGIADAYWNMGLLGIALFFLFAGLLLKYLRNNSLMNQSNFLYGIYIFYVCKLFLLFRLDFSFFFGRLIIVLPLIYYLTRSLKSENKFRELKQYRRGTRNLFI